jgi:5-(carboxyamino)imidazole ribonucleotide synthase
MCAGPAAELGITLSVFAEAEDASAALVVPSSPVGDHTVAEAVHAFAQHCDVVTFDHEHVPAHVLDLLVAEGVELHPAARCPAFRAGQARDA